MGLTHGVTDQMKQAANRLAVPDLTPPELNHDPSAGHDGGLPECAQLVAMDRASTQILHTFLTRVQQGMAAFRTMVSTAADLYQDGRQASTDELDAVARKVDDPAAPDLAAEFQQPPTPARAK
jgi:hypothetical protein